jgi:hypothetical protein
MTSQPPFDLAQAHRWFAVEFNNRAWDLVESPARSSEQTREMLSAAHASALHWRAVGKPINQLRSECLLATAYAAAGLADSAQWHANECLRLSDQLDSEQTPFDRATVHGSAASAYATAGDPNRARQHHQKLTEIAAALTEPEERALILKLYPAPD